MILKGKTGKVLALNMDSQPHSEKQHQCLISFMLFSIMLCYSVAWCSFKHTASLTLTYPQLWALGSLFSASTESLAQASIRSPVCVPRLQTDWQTESWTDRHMLYHHGYHSCCRLPPICSGWWGAAFTCLSVSGGVGFRGGSRLMHVILLIYSWNLQCFWCTMF